MTLANLLYFGVALAIMVLILKIISLPFRLIIKFIINSVIGGAILFIVYSLGFISGVATWMIVLAGLLGAPGAVIAIIVSLFL